MTLERQRLVDQLVSHEGIRLKPYLDTVGKWTIGVGRNLTDRGISDREAMVLLEHDIDEAITDLAGSFPWFVHLDAVRQRAIVELRFNLGATRFRGFKKLIAAMGRNDYSEAANQLVQSKWYGQVQKARSIRLVRQLAAGEDDV